MKNDYRLETKKKRVLNVVELGNGELVYIRLDDGKKYLLDGRCYISRATIKTGQGGSYLRAFFHNQQGYLNC